MHCEKFYDDLAPLYHLVYEDWNAAIRRQAESLNGIIREVWGDSINTILDVACGIGTQAIGLAALGYRVTASDRSSTEVERGRKEATARDLSIDFSVADMREARTGGEHDLVIACDNAVPHLLTDAEILQAFSRMLCSIRPGGGCLISVRDYDAMELGETWRQPSKERIVDGTRYEFYQVWEFRGPVYDVSLHIVEHSPGEESRERVMRTKYYAVGVKTLIELMQQAGFEQVARLDKRFFQPVLVGTRPR